MRPEGDLEHFAMRPKILEGCPQRQCHDAGKCRFPWSCWLEALAAGYWVGFWAAGLLVLLQALRAL